MKTISRRRFLSSSALAVLYGATGPALHASSKSIPWTNWSGGVVAHPEGRFSAESESHLAQFMSTSKGRIRPVGSGHSFTPLVPTDGHLVVIDKLAGAIANLTSPLV